MSEEEKNEEKNNSDSESEEEDEDDEDDPIWNEIGFSEDKLDILVANPESKLLDVLQEENLIQEIKSNNVKVITFFCADKIIKELLDLFFMTTVPKEGEDIKKEDFIYKYPFLVNEIIHCEVDQINKLFLTDENLTRFFNHLLNFDIATSESHKINVGHIYYYLKSFNFFLEKNFTRIIEYTTKVFFKEKSVEKFSKFFIKNFQLFEFDKFVMCFLGVIVKDSDFFSGLTSGNSEQNTRTFGVSNTSSDIDSIFSENDKKKRNEMENAHSAIQNLFLEHEFYLSLQKELSTRGDDVDYVNNVFTFYRTLFEQKRNRLNCQKMGTMINKFLYDGDGYISILWKFISECKPNTNIFESGLKFMNFFMEKFIFANYADLLNEEKEKIMTNKESEKITIVEEKSEIEAKPNDEKKEEEKKEEEKEEKKEDSKENKENEKVNAKLSESEIEELKKKKTQITKIISFINANMSQFYTLLNTYDSSVTPRIGAANIEIIRILKNYIKLNEFYKLSIVKEKGVTDMVNNVLKLCIKLFVLCPQNNFIHNEIYDIFQLLLLHNEQNEDFLKYLKDIALIDGMILKAFDKGKMIQRRSDEDKQDDGDKDIGVFVIVNRLPFLGVLISLGTHLLNLKEKVGDQFAKLIEGCEDDWKLFEEFALEMKKKNELKIGGEDSRTKLSYFNFEEKQDGNDNDEDDDDDDDDDEMQEKKDSDSDSDSDDEVIVKDDSSDDSDDEKKKKKKDSDSDSDSDDDVKVKEDSDSDSDDE